MDDFNKWMKIAEGDLPEIQNEKDEATCDCDSYDCEICHPLTEDELELALENFGSDLLAEEDDEEETEVDLDSDDDFDDEKLDESTDDWTTYPEGSSVDIRFADGAGVSGQKTGPYELTSKDGQVIDMTQYIDDIVSIMGSQGLEENPALMALGGAAASAAGKELGSAAANAIFSNEEEPGGMGLRAELGDDDKMIDMARNMGREMIDKGMDPDQVVITLGQQFTLDDAEQAILYKELTDPEYGHQEDCSMEGIDESDDVAKLIAEIKYNQDMGVSNHPQRFDMAKVAVAPEETVRKIHGLVCGACEMASAGAVGAGAVGGAPAAVQDPDGVYGKGRSGGGEAGFGGSDAGVGESADADLEAIKRLAGL